MPGFWHFLLWDHTFFQSAVVRSCFSYLGTTRFSGALWSDPAFLALGPHVFPEHCGLVLRFLLWDHILFRDAVVWPCASYFGTTSGAENSLFHSPFYIEGLDYHTGNTDFSQYSPAALLLLADDCPRPSPVKPLRCILRHIGIGLKNSQNRSPIGVTLFGITKAIFPGHLLKHFFFSPPDHSWGFLQDLPAAGAVFIVVIDDSACLKMGINRDRPYILKAALF